MTIAALNFSSRRKMVNVKVCAFRFFIYNLFAIVSLRNFVLKKCNKCSYVLKKIKIIKVRNFIMS